MKNLFLNLQILLLSSEYLLFDVPEEINEMFMATCFKTVYDWIKWGATIVLAFKLCQALFNYFSCDNNPQLKAQYKSDFKEPIIGLILLYVGYWIIIGLTSMLMPEILEAHPILIKGLGG